MLLIAAKVNNKDTPINLGSNKPIEIRNLVKKIHLLTNSKSKLKIGSIKYRPNEIWKMQADNRFVIQKTNWKPQIKLDEGLQISINWYRRFIQAYYRRKNSI